jgi:hypothetical protein
MVAQRLAERLLVVADADRARTPLQDDGLRLRTIQFAVDSRRAGTWAAADAASRSGSHSVDCTLSSS